MKIAVLGAGLVGRSMTLDLAKEESFAIRAVDQDKQALRAMPPNVETLCLDLRERRGLEKALQDVSLAVCAVPGFMGYELLKMVLQWGIPAVDISFFPEDPFTLMELAEGSGVAAVVDCGVAPGLCNILAAEAALDMDIVERYRCYVGGLPRIRRKPFEYAAVFSPTDVLEEYIRPARVVENGEVVIKPALSDCEQIEVDGLGTLEAFNTDGLRTMLTTFPAQNMVEKTLRYPGHADVMRAIREAGLLEKEPVQVGQLAVKPFDVTALMLRQRWALRPGDADITVMRVDVEGSRGGKRVRHRYELLDHYDVHGGTTSMARTTGYTATIVTRMVAEGMINRSGVLPPEMLVQFPGFFSRLMRGYKQRGITITTTTQPI